jgi:putative Holliday junction resolvase
MRTLAIDYGAKRTGLAMSDAGGKFASPLDVISHSDPALVTPQVVTLISKEDVERVLIGLPLGPDGGVNPASKQNIAFGDAIAAATGRPIVYVDERLSTYDADQQLNAHKRAGGKMTRQMRKERLDALAAAVFLQAFLDGQLAPIDVGAVVRNRGNGRGG